MMPVSASNIDATANQGGYDVFISYSRKDTPFVKRLFQLLQASKRKVWVDWEEIPPLAEWRDEIRRGILAADNFVFVISANSVSSSECQKEADYAIANNKRLVPVVCREVDSQKIRRELRALNWVFFLDDATFDQSFQKLITALETNLDYVRVHSRLLTQADDWWQNQRDESFLLRGQALEIVEQSLLQADLPTPALTYQQRQYVAASRLAETRHQRQTLRSRTLALGSVTLLMLIIAVLGFIAENRRRRTVIGEIEALSAAALANLALGDSFSGLITGLRAGKLAQQATWAPAKVHQTARSALAPAVYWVRESNRLIAHQDWIYGVAFSPDGALLASVSLDGAIQLWQTDGQLVQTVSGHGGSQIWDVSFSSSGEQFATAGSDSQVLLWSRSGELLNTLSDHTERVRRVAIGPNDKRLASGGDDQTVRIWRDDGNLLYRLEGHTSDITSVAFSPNGVLASTAEDGTIRLWGTDGAHLLTLSEAAESPLYDVAWSPDGEWIAAAGSGEKIWLWRADGALMQTLTGHSDVVRALNFSPDGQVIASVSDDLTVRLWRYDGSPLQILRGHQAALRDVAFSPDGGQIVTAGQDMTIRIWESLNPHHRLLIGHDQDVYALAFAPQGDRLISGGEDRTLRIWSTEGSLLQTLDLRPDIVDSVAVSPDGALIVSGSENPATGVGSVILWPVGEAQRVLGRHDTWVNRVAFSPDGEQVAAGDADGLIKFWPLVGELQKTFQHGALLYDLTYSPDGTQLASSSALAIKLWDLADGSLARTLNVKGDVYSVNFSPEGNLAFVSDQLIGLWRPNEDKFQYFSGHTAEVSAVRFSPDGRYLASASQDKTIKLWTHDGELVATLGGHQTGFEDITFHPDGNWLASASNDGSIVMWDVSILRLDSLVDIGCDWLQNYLLNSTEARPEDRQICKV